MKPQVILHLETALAHLKAAKGKQDREEHSMGFDDANGVVGWLECRGEALADGRWGDMEREANLCKLLALWFADPWKAANSQQESLDRDMDEAPIRRG